MGRGRGTRRRRPRPPCPAASARTRTSTSTPRQLHGPVPQPDGVLGRGADAAAVPDVEPEVVVVAAGRHERRGAEVRPAARSRARRGRRPSPRRCRRRAGAGGPCAGPRRPAPPAARPAPWPAASRSPAAQARRRSRGPPATGRAGGRPRARCRCRRRRAGRSPRACGGRTRPGSACRRSEAHGGAGELLAARVQQRVVVEAGVAAGRARLGGPRASTTTVSVPSPSSAVRARGAWTRSPSARCTRRPRARRRRPSGARRRAAASAAARRRRAMRVSVEVMTYSVDPAPPPENGRPSADVWTSLRPRSRSR